MSGKSLQADNNFDLDMNGQTRAEVKEHLLRRCGEYLIRFVPWLVLVISLMITYLMGVAEREDAMQHLRSGFDVRASKVGNLIKEHMGTYQQVLADAQGLFAVSDNVKRDESRSYIHMLHIDENYPVFQVDTKF